MLFKPAESSKNIVDFYKRYLLTTFQTNNENYNKQLEQHLSEPNAIAKGPFISLTDAFEKGKSILELIEEGELAKSFAKVAKLKPERTLYKHQEQALRKANKGKNLIVTTGTGSGKTESFLIPVINKLLKEEENGTLDAGVRTLVVYPMNALVNDQIRRLREIFESYPESEITFGRYTGETEGKYNKALEIYRSREGREPLKNELISREQMRETPPNILITNYAMLEYLLLRPGENIFFIEENAKKWQFIVFDEAHTYEGAKGIEVGTLVRRLKATLNNQDIQFILTSATLGDKRENQKITDFGELLCSAKFDEDSIIRSSTVSPVMAENTEKINIQIYRDLAEKIRLNSSQEDFIEYFNEKNIETYNINDEFSLASTLYNMILKDSLYGEVRKVLFGSPKTLRKSAEQLELSESDFTDFILVASNALLNGDKIFDAKYHMFLKGIEGVYITLKPSEKLFINKMETYKPNAFASEDETYKVFGISFCSNCNASFITGQTEEKDGIKYLVQKSKYNDDYQPEVYMLSENDLDTEDEIDEDIDKKYLICPHCGALKKKSALQKLNCGHNPDDFQTIIKVKESGDSLNTCPSCGSFNAQRSIIRPYLVGSEAVTAVIATALYNELPREIVKTKKYESNNRFFKTGTIVEEDTEKLTKQFLAFSDSRQAAAFFASYLGQTYRSTLIKRLMTEIAINHKEQLENGLSLGRFKDYLVNLFAKYHIYENKDEREKEAYIAILKELTNLKAKSSLQNNGVLTFDFDIRLDAIDDLGLSSEETTTMVKVLMADFLKHRAVSLPLELTEADREKYLLNGIQTSFSKAPLDNKYIKPWITKKFTQSKRFKYLKKILPQLPDEIVEEFLSGLWDEILVKQKYINKLEKQGYLFDINRIKIKPVEDLYICPKCRTITQYNLKNTCPKCLGELEEYDYKKDLKDNHYAKLFHELEIDDLIIKEHTAQLGQDLAYDYQNEFKDKKINVLSCSTTFEMGVDVGSLETVFMRNMPPTPANYAQRAGRAGRSMHSAAYALTYCPNSSHDLNYYKEPKKMIAGKINPPSFNINNKKIILRHIFASTFSLFWKKYPEFYTKTIGDFFEMNGFEKIKEYLEEKPAKLKEYLKNVISDKETLKYFDIENFGWINQLYNDNIETPGIFDIAKRKYSEKMDELIKARKEALEKAKDGDLRSSSNLRSINYSIETLKKQQPIDFLSSNNLIPKYGFPVDTVELQGFSRSGMISKLRLDRDLFNAISEYAPDSEIVANGKLIRSRYVKVLEGYEWPRHKFKECPTCKVLNRTKTAFGDNIDFCKQCGEDLSRIPLGQYIVPKFGFIAEKEEPKDVGIEKPEKTYRGQILYIGEQSNIIEEKSFVINNGTEVHLVSSKMDELAVLNTSNFYICSKCGYTITDKKAIKDVIEKEHENSRGYKCSNKNLVKLSLGHEFQTDVVILRFGNLVLNDNESWTILYSMLEGLSKYIPVNRTEISGCLYTYEGCRAFVLFDNTPGGAGYVRQLTNPKVMQEMLKNAYNIVKNCTCGSEDGDSACYACLCNYYNQRQHDDLKRKYAIDFYEKLLLGNNDFYVEEMKLFEGESSSTNADDSLKVNLTINSMGVNLFNKTYKEIEDYISDDLDEEAQEIFNKIAGFNGIELCEKPCYMANLTIHENKKTVEPILTWCKSKVIIFTDDDNDSYEMVKNSNWNVFILSKDFDESKLFKLLEKE